MLNSQPGVHQIEHLQLRLMPNTRLLWVIGKTTPLFCPVLGLKLHRPARSRGIQGSHTYVRKQEKAVYAVVNPQLNKMIGPWCRAWLARRLGIRSIIELQHFLLKGH